MAEGWNIRPPIAEPIPGAIHHDGIAEDHIDRRMGREKGTRSVQGPGQQLFVAVEIRANLAAGPPQTFVDRIIHPRIRLDLEHEAIGFRGSEARKSPGAKIFDTGRTTIAHDVLDTTRDGLIGHRSEAEFQPIQLAKTRRDDGKLHALLLRLNVVFTGGTDARTRR